MDTTSVSNTISASNILIILGGLLVTLALIWKAKTKRIKDFGRALLLYRLTALISLLALLSSAWLAIPQIALWLLPGLAVTALVYYLVSKSLLFRDFALLILAFLLFGGVVTWLATALQILLVVRDQRRPAPTIVG